MTGAAPGTDLATPLPAIASWQPAEFAATWGVSAEAAALLQSSEVIDLHLDTFIPPRLPLVRYDLFKKHEKVFLGGRFFGHLDFPRALEAGLTGAQWSITTNIMRRKSRRLKMFLANLQRVHALIARTDGRFKIVKTHSEFRAARETGAHAVMLAIQGGNALEAAPDGPGVIPDDSIVRVTVVHLTNSGYGITSSPLKWWKGKRGLTDRGKTFIQQLNARRIFVDLAHINPRGFWDAVEVHDKTQPLVATHTGVDGVKRHWRNLDDDQIRAIADTGGVVGIIFQLGFLRPRGGAKDASVILDHLQHVIDVAGEDAAALGSDYDGAIVPPKELRDGLSYVRLVQRMLDRKWSETRIRKILGENALRAFAHLRP